MGKKKEKLLIEKQFDDSIKQIKKLKKKVLNHMEKEHAEFKDSDPTIDFKKEIKDSDKTIDSLNKANEDSDISIDRLQREILKLKEENTELTKKIGKLEEKLEKRKETINKMYGDNDTLESYRDLIVKCSNLEEKYTKHKNELDETRRKLTEERDKSNSLEAQLNNAKISIEKLQKKKSEEGKTTEINDYIKDVILLILGYCVNEDYIGGIDTYIETLENIKVYNKDKFLMDECKGFFHELKDELIDIREISGTAAKTLGFINDKSDINDISYNEVIKQTRWITDDGLNLKEIESPVEFITLFSGKLKKNKDTNVEN